MSHMEVVKDGSFSHLKELNDALQSYMKHKKCFSDPLRVESGMDIRFSKKLTGQSKS